MSVSVNRGVPYQWTLSTWAAYRAGESLGGGGGGGDGDGGDGGVGTGAGTGEGSGAGPGGAASPLAYRWIQTQGPPVLLSNPLSPVIAMGGQLLLTLG